MHGFRRRHRHVCEMPAKHVIEGGDRLGPVVEPRAGAMRIDVIHLFRCQIRIGQRCAHGRRSPTRIRCRQVVRICAHAETEDLRMDCGTTCARSLPFLEHKNGCTFADHQTLPVFGKGPAYIGAQHAQRIPRLHETDDDGGVAAARQRAVDQAATDHVKRQPDRMRGRGTGGGHGKAWPAQAEFHRQMARRRIGHDARDCHRRQPLGIFAVQRLVGRIECLLADRRPQDDPGACRIRPRRTAVAARIRHCFTAGHQRQLRGTIHHVALPFAEMRGRIEANDLGGRLHRQSLGRNSRNTPYAAQPLRCGRPVGRHIRPQRCNGAKAGDHHAPPDDHGGGGVEPPSAP